MTPLEIAANAPVALSIGWAVPNPMPTWCTGIIGSAFFAAAFYPAQWHADPILQVWCMAISGIGWWHWQGDSRTAKGCTPPACRTCIGLA